jgi:acyl-CoA thioester hydrolase
MVSKTQIRVRYAETDQMGVAHHAAYPVWYETARADFCREMGIPYAEMEQGGLLCPVVELSCRYAGAARYDELVTVEARIAHCRPSRVEFYYRICREGEDRPFHTGATLHAWVDAATFRPVNAKKRFGEWYAIFQAAAQPQG